MSMEAKYIVASLFDVMPHVLPPVLLSHSPVFLQQLRHHHLKMLTADAVNPCHVQLLPSAGFFFSF